MLIPKTALAGFVALLIAQAVVSQSQTPGSRTVYFSLEGKNKQPITDLKPEELRVLDDGKPQAVASLSAAGDKPLAVTFLVDIGGAAQLVRDSWRPEIEPFIRGIIRPSIDSARVIGFNTETLLLQQPTDNMPFLLAAFDRLKFSGGTAINDAITLATRQSDGAARRVFVIISDGVDVTQNMLEERSMKPVQQAGVIVYAVSIKRPTGVGQTLASAQIEVGHNFLDHMGTQTGGRALIPGSSKELRVFFASIIEELRSQYAVNYTPADNRTNGVFRKLKIEVNRKDAKVHHPSGYYTTQP